MSSRCLLTVHAHPDDEASKGAATCRKYHEAGVRTVLVTATGGEEGSILNPALDRPEIAENLAAVRRDELATAAKIIGFDRVELMGYRDSGMPDSEANARPEAFWNIPIDESTRRLVEIIREERPQVILTYNDDHTGYPHPDHIRVHEISVLAFERAGDPEWYPEAGEPWQPLKLYYSVWSRERLEKIHARFGELGLESPFDERWFDRPSQDHRITTRIEVEEYYEVRKQALLAHATQVDPESPFWFGLPDEDLRSIHPFEEYVLAQHRLDPAPEGIEDDLFAGID